MHAVLFSFIDDSSRGYIEMETFDNKAGWIHGFIDLGKNTYEPEFRT